MAGKVGYLNVFGYNFTFVFRHKYEKYGEDEEGEKLTDQMIMWNDYKLGFWYKNYQVVGKKNFHILKEWDNNLVREHMFGIYLLICEAWFTVSKGGMHLDTDEDKFPFKSDAGKDNEDEEEENE
jgi:hypothetical protein